MASLLKERRGSNMKSKASLQCTCVYIFSRRACDVMRERATLPLSPTFPSSCRIHEERVKPSGLASTSTCPRWLHLPLLQSCYGCFCLPTVQCRDLQAAVKLGRPDVSLARGKALRSQVPQMSEHSRTEKGKFQRQSRNKSRA